jgi:hypothetical protein
MRIQMEYIHHVEEYGPSIGRKVYPAVLEASELLRTESAQSPTRRDLQMVPMGAQDQDEDQGGEREQSLLELVCQ